MWKHQKAAVNVMHQRTVVATLQDLYQGYELTDTMHKNAIINEWSNDVSPELANANEDFLEAKVL